MNHRLACQSCGGTVDPGGYPLGCPDCHEAGRVGRLEVVMQYPADFEGALVDRDDMWRYRAMLPLLAEDPITLGEGNTPLVGLGGANGTDATVHLKNETMNPTWSFKDRLNALLISNATALGARHFATSSTGNHGASTAAYARRAGAGEVIVLLPPETDRPLVAQIQAYGAHAVVTGIEGRRPLLRALVERGWYPTVSISRAYAGVPYGYEGYKTIAFELVDQLDEPPDAVVVAIGAGDGLYGTWKGFRELRELGVIEDAPRMIGVQPAERPSVVEAHERGATSVGETPGPMPITISTSGPTAGDHALRAIDESNGVAIAVEREAVEAAVGLTGRDGVFLEPASALTVGALDRAQETGAIDPGDTVICLATGAGVKWPAYTIPIVGDAVEIEPTLEALDRALSIELTVGDR